jgi:hypothetical protein
MGKTNRLTFNIRIEITALGIGWWFFCAHTNSESTLPKSKEDEQEERRNGGEDKTEAREKTTRISRFFSLFLRFSVPPVNPFFSYFRQR